ncbi:ATP-dependent DNA helicase pfh1 [Sesamum alatum]|uniref:ATP-dependent DNA helicase n=1 Tax=Sesamum alatum TaxID=300844 RepID=A0AAE2CY94_9LAMI|nr:ATP-dependent DNA helicase pfh1 [Sesamum alatum]
MKLLSFTIAAYRQFSSQPAAFEKKNWGKNYFFKNKKKYDGSGTKIPKQPRIKWTDEQKQALDAVSSGKSVFITGSAGTGKTFLLEHVIKKLKRIHGKSKVYVTAPTGVAACALNGQTLHSFAGIGIADGDCGSLVDMVLDDRHARYRWRKVKALVIDEISMVDANLFEGLAHIARTLRDEEASMHENKSWGGIQMIVSGDFFQLPPVLKKRKKKGAKIYAFEAECWSATFDLQIELTTVFRQSDSLLVQLLQGIRKGENDSDDLKLLEGCCSGYEPDPSAVRLFPMLTDVNMVNKEKLESLNEEIYVYKAQDLGEEKWMKQLKKGIAPDELELCVGARVMLIKNINPWRKLVNGATGTVVELCKVSKEQYEMDDMCSHGGVLPLVKFDSGLELVVEPEIWVVMEGDKVVARRRQIPLMLAWALSIHKCQGMTLDKLHTDLSRVFDFGMVYVALSRVRSLGGLYLAGLDPSKIKAHPKVLEFYHSFNGGQHENEEVFISSGSDTDDGNSRNDSNKKIAHKTK